MVARVRAIAREWRYVVVSGRVVAGSRYDTDRHASSPDEPGAPSWRFASAVAEQLDAPEDVYVMDVCEAAGELRLLELNPFSGANLYACSLPDVVAAVSGEALRALRG